uniref:Uncharacterized protein n=1 Tax=Panagrolaimus sp. ES5 TaxID=591445 RepID=A0AC34F2W5_9BILA
MVIKRRSLSNVSTLSVHDKINRYHALTDLSPDDSECLPPPIIDAPPKKQRTFLKNFKKANVFNFIRKRAKTDLKSVESITNLSEIDRMSKDFSDSRPLSDPGTGNIRIFKSVTFNDPKYLVFASFSFANGQISSKTKTFSRKELVKLSKYIYRCILYSSEGLSGGCEWEMIGCSENLILSDDLDLQFSFVTPFEIRYDYEADTTLRFELQQSRLILDKYSTYSENQNLSIDKVRRIPKMSDNNNNFTTIAFASCELNKLANRGFFKAEMNMKHKQMNSVCSIYLGAEPATVMEKSQGSLSFDLQVILKQYLNNTSEQLFNTYTPYRLMISRFFKSANAFISIYKSREFSLTFSNSNFKAELNDIELHQYHFLKFDSMFRIAIIEANTEKWRCCESIRDSSLSSSRPTSKTDQDLNNNIDNSEENDGEDVGTIIANGHTQAYLMSILQPNKRILVREIYPDREVITEYQQ